MLPARRSRESSGDAFGTRRLPTRVSRASILYMTTIPLAEARAQLSRLVDEAVRTHQRVEITRNGRRSAVLMGSDDYDSMNETLDVLADAELVAEIGIALAESRESRVHTLESVRDEMERTGRLPR